MPAVRRVQCAEEANDRLGGNGDLIARVPFSVVGMGRDADTIGVVALAVGEQAVDFVKTIRMHPRAVIVGLFSTVEQIARTELLRYAENGSPIGVRAAFHLEEVLRQRLGKLHIGIRGRAEVANIGVIGTFLEIHPLHKLRDDGVHVRVALAVRVRGQVQRHIVEEDSDIRAVVEIEAAKKVLVGLAATRVLRDDEAGHCLQNLA